MLSVAVQKDIAEYQPKVIGKMTSRTLISIVGAVGAGVIAAVYMYYVIGINPSDCMYVIYAVTLPFWCCGFITPHGMHFEEFAPLWLRANFTNDRIFYIPSMVLARLVKDPDVKAEKKGSVYGKAYSKQCKLNGIEAYSPRAGRVIA